MSESPVSPTILGALQALVTWLDDEQVPNAIIGAVGVCLAAQPRLTTDIDAVIWIDRDRWESLIDSAAANGFSLREDQLRDGDPLAFSVRTRVLLLTHEPSSVDIDLSFGALPFEQELIDHADAVAVRGFTVKVATPEDLIITKAVASRPKDIADIDLIVSVRKELDWERIRYWVRQFADVLEMPEIVERLERALQPVTVARSSRARSMKAPLKQRKKQKE
ncbi:MAG TPA: nucleotidyl transferase AbiEii/AbiGii toxin family protein [Blastocatellia bacterium]|nr:nucleotidyl transferase AbiEii/AbiGii toxin family protein [Blastocatellia bacterium]